MLTRALAARFLSWTGWALLLLLLVLLLTAQGPFNFARLSNGNPNIWLLAVVGMMALIGAHYLRQASSVTPVLVLISIMLACSVLVPLTWYPSAYSLLITVIAGGLITLSLLGLGASSYRGWTIPGALIVLAALWGLGFLAQVNIQNDALFRTIVQQRSIASPFDVLSIAGRGVETFSRSEFRSDITRRGCTVHDAWCVTLIAGNSPDVIADRINSSPDHWELMLDDGVRVWVAQAAPNVVVNLRGVDGATVVTAFRLDE